MRKWMTFTMRMLLLHGTAGAEVVQADEPMAIRLHILSKLITSEKMFYQVDQKDETGEWVETNDHSPFED